MSPNKIKIVTLLLIEIPTLIKIIIKRRNTMSKMKIDNKMANQLLKSMRILTKMVESV